MALLTASTVQRDGLEDLGAPAGMIAMLTTELVRLREQLEAESPELFEPPKPRWTASSIPTPSIPGLDAIKSWLADRLDQLWDVTKMVAGRLKDAALATVERTLPTLAEVALSLVGTVEGSVAFIGENLAQLDDVALALARGVGGGLESAAGELGNRIVSAAGYALSAFISPLEDVAVPIRSGTPQVLEPGPRA